MSDIIYTGECTALGDVEPAKISFDSRCITDFGIKSAIAYLESAVKKQVANVNDKQKCYHNLDQLDLMINSPRENGKGYFDD